MLMQNAIRAIFFVVFFSIGAGALGTSILCDDLLAYYHNKRLLKETEESLEQLERLNTSYDAILEQVEDDPNFFKRIAPATLGIEPDEANTVYPEETVEKLEAARKALSKDKGSKVAEPKVPEWLSRCSEPRRRIVLFLAGAVLILISFMCFGSVKPLATKQE